MFLYKRILGQLIIKFNMTNIEKHFKYTKSIKAKELLNDFEKFESFFWLVIPAASNIQDLLKATTANAA